MKPKISKTWLAVIATAGLTQGVLLAQNPSFDTGDLILFFQKPGDDDTVFVGLGPARTLYRGSAAGPTADRQALNIVNINAALTTAYGAGWASDPGIYAGVAGCRSSSTGTQVFEGDQTRTLYVSRPRIGVGTIGTANSTAWNLNQGQTQNAAATKIVGALSNDFETNHLTQVASAPIGSSTIDDQNPFIATGIQGPAFAAFTGGVQQVGSAASFGTFGPAGSVEFALDLNRIVPRNDLQTANEVSGPVLVGTYEGTIVVGTDGNVSFITSASASPYETWIAGFPLLVTLTDKLPETDFDNDGFTNAEEFVLNGNPEVSGQAIAPALSLNATDFFFSFTRRIDSESEAPATFEYSSDLLNWTGATVTSSGVVAATTVSVTEGDAVTDVISVKVPKTTAVGNKLFGRIKVVK